MGDVLARAPASAPATDQRSRDQAERLVLHLITTQAESLLRVARRYSYCADDAQDAYQRALELLLRHAHRLDPDRAAGWIHTVVKHEALEVRRQRGRLVGMEEADLERLEERTSESPEERVIGIERVARTAEALRRVKPDEARAMWLKASGESYASIGEKLSWSYTKVNRCLAEGRKSFLEHFAGLEAGESCAGWLPVLTAIVDGEADADAVVDARAHLRHCTPCRATLRQLRTTDRSLAMLLPVGGGVPIAGGLDLDLDAGVADGPSGLLARLADTLGSFFHERAAAATVRLQSTIDLAANHKVAAVAASAAAMAGGGVAVEQARPVLDARRPPAHVRPAARPDHAALRPSAAVVRRVTTGGPPTAATTTHHPPHSPSKPWPPAPITRTAPTPEPLVDPVEATAAPNDSTATASAAPARAPAAPPSTAAKGPDPTAEFGFETP